MNYSRVQASCHRLLNSQFCLPFSERWLWRHLVGLNGVYSVEIQFCLIPASRWFLAWLILRPSEWRRYVPLKRRLTFSGLHGVISRLIRLQLFCYRHVNLINRGSSSNVILNLNSQGSSSAMAVGNSPQIQNYWSASLVSFSGGTWVSIDWSKSDRSLIPTNLRDNVGVTSELKNFMFRISYTICLRMHEYYLLFLLTSKGSPCNLDDCLPSLLYVYHAPLPESRNLRIWLHWASSWYMT
jgi:hypothetical protein